MPEYEYECEACNKPFSEFLTLSKFKKRKKCPNCGKNKLVYIYSGVYSSVVKEPTTVGQLADRNTSKMGTYEYEAKMKETIEKNPSADPVKRAENAKMRKIINADAHAKQKYIETGILF